MSVHNKHEADHSADRFDWRLALPNSWYAHVPEEFEHLRKHGVLAEVLAAIDPASSAVKVRIVVEWLVRKAYAEAPGGQGRHVSVGGLLRQRAVKMILGDDFAKALLQLVDHGNAGAHGRAPAIESFHALHELGAATREVLARERTSLPAALPAYFYNRTTMLQPLLSFLRTLDEREFGPRIASNESRSMQALEHTQRDTAPSSWEGPLSDSSCPTPRAYLVRTHRETVVLQVDDDGNVVRTERLPDLWFGCGESVWEWTSQVVRLPVQHLAEVEDLDFDEPPKLIVNVPLPLGTYVRLHDGLTVRLQPDDWRQGEAPAWPPFRRWPRFEPLAFAGHTAGHFGYFGTYAGGAHGDAEAQYEAFHLGTGERVDLVSSVLDFVRNDVSAAESVRSAWNNTVPDDERLFDWIADDVGPWESLDLTVVSLDFSQVGSVRLRTQWTKDTYYAASDGNWSDYTRSVGVVLDFLPPELEGLHDVPSPVLQRWRDDTDDFFGWSEVSGTALAQIDARYSFDEGI